MYAKELQVERYPKNSKIVGFFLKINDLCCILKTKKMRSTLHKLLGKRDNGKATRTSRLHRLHMMNKKVLTVKK